MFWHRRAKKQLHMLICMTSLVGCIHHLAHDEVTFCTMVISFWVFGSSNYIVGSFVKTVESCLRFVIKRSSDEPRENVPTDIPTRLMSRKDERICNRAFFYLEWRTSWTRVIDSTWNQVSAQRGIAIVELVCFLTLPILFGSKIFSSGACVHSNHSQNECHRHCAPPRNYGLSKKEHSLHVNYTPRA
jgi:hypothetical protein